MWLLGRFPVISVQFLQIQILTRSRDVSVQCQPTDSLAADLAHNCPPNYAAGPELPRPIAQLATNPPQLATKRCKPSPTSAKPPEAVSKFHQPRQSSEVYQPFRKSPTFSTRRSPEYPSTWFAAGPKCPPTRIATLSKPRASPTRFAAGPECPPTRIAAISAFSCRLQPKPSHISHAGEL